MIREKRRQFMTQNKKNANEYDWQNDDTPSKFYS